MPNQIQDADLIKSAALPNGAKTTQTEAIDLGDRSARGDFLANVEFLADAPAIPVAALADAATMKYKVETDEDAAFGSAKTLVADLIVQTGAGGAGAAAASARFRVPSNVERYVRLAATNSAAGDASALNMSLKALF
jgi:hypothetical protein